MTKQQQQKQRPKQKQPKRMTAKPPKDYMARLPRSSKAAGIAMPPMMLVPTASPFVYISEPALAARNGTDGNSQEGDGDIDIDPSTLFAESMSPSLYDATGSNDGTFSEGHHAGGTSVPSQSSLSIPPMFARGEFEYFSPKTDFRDYGYPTDGKPEVAFLGRSNVGKSSLVNALMRSNLCVTSKLPGRTRLPHYYGLTPKHIIHERIKQSQKQKPQQQQRTWPNKSSSNSSSSSSIFRKDASQVDGFLVDLPGYGYGTAPKHVVETWQEDTQNWLLNRRHGDGEGCGALQRVFLLLDSRRGGDGDGPSELDLSVISWLEEASIPYTIVLTKADRVSVPLVVRQVNDMCLRYAAASAASFSLSSSMMMTADDDDTVTAADFMDVPVQSPIVHVTSSTRGWGITELMLSIESEFWTE